MRKTFLFLSLFLLWTMVYGLSTIYAAPCYGTQMPKSDKWTAGVEADVIAKRKLSDSYGEISSRQYYYQITWGVIDWFCIDAKVGVGDITYKPQTGDKTTFGTNFAGGYGFRVKPYSNPANGVDAVLGFQHISVHPSGKIIDGNTNNVIIDDWQGSALVSKGIGLFTPYIGTRLSRIDLIHKIKTEGRKRKKSDVDFTGVAGVDYKIGNNYFVNAETRFIKETSFNIGLTYNF